jgi:hypothetical protein
MTERKKPIPKPEPGAKRPRAKVKPAPKKKAKGTKKQALPCDTAKFPLAVIPEPPPPPPFVPPTPNELFRAWRDQDEAGNIAMADLADYIVSEGHLPGFCRERGFPYSTVRSWIEASEARVALYARAREDRADVFADNTQSIADEECSAPVIVQGVLVGYAVDSAAVQRNKLRVETRKWLAAKMKPRVYSDKLDVTANVTHDIRTVSDEDLVRTLNAMGVAVPALGSKPGQDAANDQKVGMPSMHTSVPVRAA